MEGNENENETIRQSPIQRNTVYDDCDGVAKVGDVSCTYGLDLTNESESKNESVDPSYDG